MNIVYDDVNVKFEELLVIQPYLNMWPGVSIPLCALSIVQAEEPTYASSCTLCRLFERQSAIVSVHSCGHDICSELAPT